MVPAFYGDATELLVKNSVHRTINAGLWDCETKSEEEAIVRSIHKLVSGCSLGPGKSVLDLGCGLGGPAVILAREFGVHVTAVSNCEPHVELAEQFAQEQGVGDLVEFHCCDFMDLPFPDDRYDLAVNHGSFSHVYDTLAYLKGVHRVLKSGGRWQVLDCFLGDKPLTTPSHEQMHETIQQAMRIAPLISLDQMFDALKQAGYHTISNEKLDHEVLISIEKLAVQWRTFLFLTPPLTEPKQTAFRDCIEGAIEFGRGLHHGIFTYQWVSGTKPKLDNVSQ